jgi:hypothetical protein
MISFAMSKTDFQVSIFVLINRFSSVVSYCFENKIFSFTAKIKKKFKREATVSMQFIISDG